MVEGTDKEFVQFVQRWCPGNMTDKGNRFYENTPIDEFMMEQSLQKGRVVVKETLERVVRKEENEGDEVGVVGKTTTKNSSRMSGPPERVMEKTRSVLPKVNPCYGHPVFDHLVCSSFYSSPSAVRLGPH